MPPLPFGHACAPREGALYCPTAADAARVPSFDGVPLDVDYGVLVPTARGFGRSCGVPVSRTPDCWRGVEVPGRDAPTYRPSNGSFSVAVSRLRVTVPTRERRPR